MAHALRLPPDELVRDARRYGLRGDGVTNDQPALAALVSELGDAYAADGQPRMIWCPPGVYAIQDAGTAWRSGVSLVGAGPGITRFVLGNPGNRAEPVPLAHFTSEQHGAGRDNHLADCVFAGFEIDGSGVALTRYDHRAKGLGLQYVLRGRFQDLYIHDTAATGLGCDFLQDTVISGVVANGCGRLDNGSDLGGAGIGVGIGGWGTSERLCITACTTVGNGTNGIFVELQKDWWPRPRGIRIVGCHAEGNRFGISDWGADGLVVSACTMLGNLEAGFDVSALSRAGVAGRGGIVADCVIDGNVRDGISVGNTPGPYAIRGNRISGNGGYGYREHNLGRGYQEPALDIVLDGNEIWGNSLDGVRVDRALTDAALVGNRIRNNGRRMEPAASGAGPSVAYTATTLVDTTADWAPDGHRGKLLRVGERTAVVTANTATVLTLAPVRPGAPTAWSGPVPAPGTGYRLPAAPEVRAGIAIAAPVDSATIRANRIWDNQHEKTQDHGIWINDRGRCVGCRVVDNELAGNAGSALRLDTAPVGGRWAGNGDEPDRV
nr:right-handed parallel beta-helix repeat-containing protein [Micromonospora echinofusca]